MTLKKIFINNSVTNKKKKKIEVSVKNGIFPYVYVN